MEETVVVVEMWWITHPTSRMHQHPQRKDGAGLSLTSTRRTANIYQNLTKGCSKQIARTYLSFSIYSKGWSFTSVTGSSPTLTVNHNGFRFEFSTLATTRLLELTVHGGDPVQTALRKSKLDHD